MSSILNPEQTGGPSLPLAASERLMQRMSGSMPGGDTRTSTYFLPFPIVLDRGAGYRVWDVDGNEYIDVLNNFTSLVHGHAHPSIIEAAVTQARQGTSFSAPQICQGELAERLTDRIQSVERVRFTNSGTEAIMQAVRAARALTGRDLIVKSHGGYHGSWDQVPMTVDDQLGTPDSTTNLIRWVDFNDTESLEATMSSVGDRTAAVLLEPVMGAGGVLEGTKDFLETARRVATEHGALLVLDEIITLRLGMGGQQEAVGITPDLTTMGKIIGGGLPVGAVGGSAEAMDVFDPRREHHLYHGGTFNGNPMTMVAGAVSLDLLDHERLETLNKLGAQAAKGIAEAMVGRIPGQVTSAGSLIQLHPGSNGEIRTFSDVDLAHPLLTALHNACLEEGLFTARRGLLSLSTVMDSTVVEEIVERFDRAVGRVVENVDAGLFA